MTPLPIFLMTLASLAATAAATARPLADMVESKEFVICAAPDDMPFSAKGTPSTGLYIDLGAMIARELGAALAVRWVPARQHVRRVKCDAIMGAAVLKAPDEASGKSMRSALTAPYMRAMSVIIASDRIGNIGHLDQLRQYHVAAPSGSWAHKYLNDHAIPVWVRFRNDPEIIGAVARGDAEGGIVSNLAIGWHQKVNGANGIRVFDQLLDPQEFGFDVAINLLDTDQAAIDKVNSILAVRTKDGTISAVVAGYGIDPQPTAGEWPQ